nr:PEP/pyruvate-binding domain-containing protein [Cyclobacterium marinum]|tara:strand:+ start:44579 stop:44770 length:192 start_codon:yes stop_codon:yes gene_type:complete
MKTYIKYFNEIGINDIPQVGGKNASLGEMYQNLSDKGIAVPYGFALTSEAYWDFLDHNDLGNN